MSAHISNDLCQKIEPEVLTKLLARSNLSVCDRKIAIMRITRSMPYCDIAAAVNMDRSTVSTRMHKVIVPRLLELLQSSP